MKKRQATRELLDYFGIFSVFFVSFVAIYCMYVFDNFNFYFNVFSDLGTNSKTAVFFNSAIFIKSLIDMVFIWHVTRELKIQNNSIKLAMYIPALLFPFIAVFTNAPETKGIHWIFVFLVFSGWMFFQYIVAHVLNVKLFRERTRSIIIIEIIFTLFCMSSRIFWLTGEIIIFFFFVYWMWFLQKELIKL